MRQKIWSYPYNYGTFFFFLCRRMGAVYHLDVKKDSIDVYVLREILQEEK